MCDTNITITNSGKKPAIVDKVTCVSFLSASEEISIINIMIESDYKLIEEKLFNTFKVGDSEVKTLFLKNKYLYIFEDGVSNYLEAYNKMNSPADNNDKVTECNAINAIITQTMNEYNEIDLISLGSAHFELESSFLAGENSSKNKINSFYPVDVSASLIQLGIISFNDKNITETKLKPIIADFFNLSELVSDGKASCIPFLQTQKPRVFTLLGGTLGNYNEMGLLSAIKDFMLKGDILILGIEGYSNGDATDVQEAVRKKYVNLENSKFLLEPLLHIPHYQGFVNKPEKYLKLNDNFLTQNKEEDKEERLILTSLENSVCFAPRFKPKDFDNTVNEVILAHSTKYSIESFMVWIGENFKDEFAVVSINFNEICRYININKNNTETLKKYFITLRKLTTHEGLATTK